MIEAVINHSLHLLAEILPVFLLAILCSSLIDKFLPDSYLNFAKANFLTIGAASFIGSLVPICTCGMIPLTIKLHQKGLNWKLLCAFLVAGNACSIPALILSSVLGWKLVLLRLFASVVFGLLVTYLLLVFLGNDFKLKISAPCCGHEHNETALVTKILKDLKEMIVSFLPWIVLAVVIASVMHYFAGSISAYMIDSSFLAAIIGFPFYFCAGADIPISRELLSMGLSVGTVMSFMLASPGVNLTSLLVYKQVLGWKQSWVFLLVSALAAALIGIIIG